MFLVREEVNNKLAYLMDDMAKLLGSAAQVLNYDSGEDTTEQVLATQNKTNSQARTLYNTKAQEQAQMAKTIPKLIDGLGTSEAEKIPDFDALAKQYNLQYGRSFADFNDLIDSFNLSRLPSYESVPMPFIGHIIMTRPSLYVWPTSSNETYSVSNNIAETPSMTKNFNAMRNHPKTSAFVNDAYGQKLVKMLSHNNGNCYMPLFTTRATSYSVNDVQLKSVEKGQTYYGHTIKYAHYNEEHKFGGSISIDFRNDYYFSVLKAIYIWMAYIDIVSRGEIIKPSYVSQMNGILDYCGSIYYLVTDMSMSKLQYWEKLTGVYPRSAPFSMFSYNDAPGLEDKLTIEFDYGMKSDPCDPNVLFDLNMLSSGSYTAAANYMRFGPSYNLKDIDYRSAENAHHWSRSVRADNFKGPFGLGDAFAAKPIIQSKKVGNTLNYYLHWMK